MQQAHAHAHTHTHAHSSDKLPYFTLVEEAVPEKDLLLLLLEGRDSCKSVPKKHLKKA